jgi:TPR repeat protein
LTSKGFTFNQPKLPGMNNIDRMPFDDFFHIDGIDTLLPSFPPKSIQEIIRLVDADKSDEISILEWLDVIENAAQWKQLNTDEAYDACRAIWTAIGINSLLADIAFFKVGLALDGKKSSIHKDLLSSMHIARKVVTNYENKEKLDWLISLQSKDWDELALSCIQSFMTPLQRISILKLPKANEYYQMLPDKLISAVSDPLDHKSDTWLDRCFYSFKTTQERLMFCEEAINSYDDYGFELKKIIIEYCMPDVDDSFWYDLNENSKLTLKKKFNISNYYELKNISRLICSIDGVEALQLEEHEVRQIHSRTMFWSNYSSRFNRIRCLLPSLTYNFISKTTKKLSSQIEAFSEEKESNYEVYIFELEKIIVVEFLRGGLNETRFFKNNEWNAKRLFESEDLTVDAIREISQLDVHDHVSSWQYFCEKLLRTKLKVVPDDNLPYFRGLPPSVNQYNSKTGLIKPDFSYLDERSRKLAPWVERFWQDEFKTAKYGNQSDLQKKSNVYLTKAYTARQLGNEDEYQLYLKKSAEQGNSEAMWQLGRSLLLGRGNSPKSRIDGETWIAKAAGKNHLEAVEAAKKYSITALKDDAENHVQISDSRGMKKVEELRKEAMSGNYDSMCIYGVRLSGRLAPSDRKAGLHFLKNALSIDQQKTIPFLWEVIEKAKKNKRFDTYLEALDILANIKNVEALIEKGSFLSKQASQISRHKGIESLYKAAQQNNQNAFDLLWDIVTMSKFKNRIDDYELTLNLLIKLNDAAAKLMLSKHIKDVY